MAIAPTDLRVKGRASEPVPQTGENAFDAETQSRGGPFREGRSASGTERAEAALGVIASFSASSSAPVPFK